MTFTSVAQANSKTAEFARLFDLFDRIATRRTRTLTGDTRDDISPDDIANVPAEFVPVLKNLSTILSSRARRDEEHVRRVPVASTTQPRHNPSLANTPYTTRPTKNPTPRADAVEPSDDVEKLEETENPTFPLGERYPFTFKLMLHKLYDLDEWAEKVKDAVETSKSQFKPLAERVQNAVRDVTTSVNVREKGERRSGLLPTLGSSAKFKPPSATRPQAHSTARDATTNSRERGEKRNSVRPVLGTSAKFKPPSPARHPHVVTMTSKLEATRVLKKRCIGRRKSVNGPISTGVWVYDAAISATEVTGSRPAVEITLSAPRDAGHGGVVESRVRHRSLTALEELQTRDAARRKVKITVPLLQEEVAESAPRKPSSVSKGVIETESVVKKRKSMASGFASASESCKRVAVKRPLCV